MQKVWLQLSGVTAIAALTLLGAAPLLTAQEAGMKTAAEELDKRTKPADGASGGQQGKLSDRSVNVMSSLAFSIMPEEYPGADGKPLKVNKANPNKFLIPVDDARRIIRVATRSAYAEACELPELERANFEAMMKNEQARNTWTREQLLFIRALHIFSVSYFTGNMKITATEEENDVKGAKTAADLAESEGKDPATAQQGQGTADPEQSKVLAPKKLACPPEQKEKVTKSINAYVQSAKAEAPPEGAKPAAPATPAASEAPKSAPPAPKVAPAPAGAPD
jgi:hypothetical protein